MRTLKWKRIGKQDKETAKVLFSFALSNYLTISPHVKHLSRHKPPQTDIKNDERKKPKSNTFQVFDLGSIWCTKFFYKSFFFGGGKNL